MNLRQENKGKALVWASRRGLLEQVCLLLQNGPNDVALRQVDEWSFTPAHLAAFYGHLEVVRVLVEAGADLAARARAGVTPLHCASMQGHSEIAELLLTAGSDASWADDEGRPASHSAASDNHCDVLDILVAAGDDLARVDKNGNSILHAAASGGAREAFSMLVRTRGDSLPWRNNTAWTPLHKAVVESSFDTVKLILEVAAGSQFKDGHFDIDSPISDDGASPLILAARRGSQSVVELLLNHGANIHATDQWRCTALHSAVHAGHTEIVRTLIRRGADVNAKHTGGDGSIDGEYGMNAVLDAVHFGHIETLEVLLEAGAGISDTVTAEGYTVLHVAAYKGDLAFLRLLLKMKLPMGVDSASFDGTTPLIIATGAGRLDSIRLLLDHGADVSIADYAGWTPLHWAANRNHPHVVRLLIDCGADPTIESADGDTPLSICPFSLEGKDLEDMQGLLLAAERGWYERDASRDSLKQLLSAARSGKLDSITSLFEKGQVDANSADEDGYTALLFAAEAGQDAAVKLLIGLGTEIESKNNSGETSLWLAAHYGHGTVVQTLLESGADPNSADELGQTPVSAAAEGGHLQAVSSLLARDADIDIKTCYGKNALMFAAENGNDAVIRTLSSHKEGSKSAFDLSDMSASLVQADEFGHSTKKIPRIKDVEPGTEVRGDNIVDGASEDGNIHATGGTGASAKASESNTRGPDEGDFGTELVELAEKGMRAAVVRLIEVGHPTDKMDRRGYLALNTAAVNGHVSMVRTLLDRGADPNLKDRLGRTAIWWAAYNGWYEVANVLLDAGADLNITDHVLQLSPLMAATYRGRAKVLKLLLSGGDKELTEKHGYSALGLAVRFRHIDAVKILLESGANVEYGPDPSRTPLIDAVEQGDTEIVNLLLEAGATMQTSTDNRSPLCIAAQRGFEDVVALLLKHGAKVDHVTVHKRTPLFFAAATGHGMVARMLIEAEVSQVSHKDENGLTALSWSKMQGHEGVASVLRHASRVNHDSGVWSVASDIPNRGCYSYVPLSKPGCIRLIDLHPGQKADALSFDLYEANLDHEPSYTALSYEWKAKTGTIPVLCCGRSLLITPNLKAALQKIRSQQKARTLWVDAVCINQEDVEERTSQVRLMTKIYKEAQEVLMWLGEDSPEVAAAFASIPRVLDAWDQLSSVGFFTYSLSSDVQKALEALDLCKRVFGSANGGGAYDRKAANGVTDLLSRSYFTRAWIYQELILGGARGTVLCGELCAPWRDFHHYMAMWAVFNGGEQPRGRDIMMLIARTQEMATRGGIKDMGSAIQILTHLNCGDPRDKVFAVLGVVDSDWSGQLAPDYSLSAQQVYINAARVMVRTTEGLGFWQGINYPAANKIPDLPSWVPDWTCISARHRELDDGAVLPCLFRQPVGRAIPSLLGSQFHSTGTTLHANGYVLGEIAFSVTMRTGEDIYDHIVRPLAEGLARSGRSIFDSCSFTEGLSYLSVFCRFLHRSQGNEEIQGDRGYSSAEEFLAWRISTDPHIPDAFRKVPVELGKAIRQYDDQSTSNVTTFNHEVHVICNEMEKQLSSRLREHNNISANAPHGMTLASCDLFYTLDGHLGVSGEGTSESGLVLSLLEGFGSLAMMRKKDAEAEDESYEYVGAADILELDWGSYQTVNDIPINGSVKRLAIL
ncbi:unnamed protein product [Clonostachys solani]|uniref:Heterokaryon incompatibility domain-containing protein n=1 Tax=Clonostachys solani TaxID=160281 RepID=A0A9P0ELC5_9HYPO|nr:unnamed protein product [Clonostachys solani]